MISVDVLVGVDGSVVREIVNRGDGTGTKTVWVDGVPTVTEVSGLPIPTPDPPDPLEELRSQIAAQQEIIDALLGVTNG